MRRHDRFREQLDGLKLQEAPAEKTVDFPSQRGQALISGRPANASSIRHVEMSNRARRAEDRKKIIIKAYHHTMRLTVPKPMRRVNKVRGSSPTATSRGSRAAGSRSAAVSGSFAENRSKIFR